MGKWSSITFGGATVLLTIGGVLVADGTAPTDPAIGWWIIRGALVLFLVGTLTYLMEHWSREYDREFDGPKGRLYDGFNRVYGSWKLSTHAVLLQEPAAPNDLPVDCYRLADGCRTWVRGAQDGSPPWSPEYIILRFADYVYWSPTNRPITVDTDRAREVMTDYLARVAARARWLTPFRYWVRWRVRDDMIHARFLLALAVALRKTTHAKSDLSDTALERVPLLWP